VEVEPVLPPYRPRLIPVPELKVIVLNLAKAWQIPRTIFDLKDLSEVLQQL